jgi:general secretion pathway protein H
VPFPIVTMKEQGFTLVEILVVLIIVSVMSGVVVTSLPSSFQDGDFDEETLRLKTVMDLVREESLTQASEYGFDTDKDSYSFYVYNEIEQHWEQLESRPYTERKLTEGTTLRMIIEDSELVLGGGEEDAESAQNAPHVLLLSSGEMTPFELTIARGREQFRTLVSDGYGELQWQDELDEKKNKRPKSFD